MRIPDWVVYAVVLVAIVVTLFSSGAGGRERPYTIPRPEIAEPFTPEPLQPEDDIFAEPRPMPEPGPLLPDSHPFDERVVVQVDAPEDGIGTAFAINQSGLWLTARHVVDGCTRVGLSVGNGRMVRVDEVRTSLDTDLALLITDRAPVALQLGLDRELRVGETAFHVGFPQGESGEAVSTLESRSNLITRGRYEMEEPVLAWSERGRSEGINGTLSGMSGGPVFDVDGAVIGVTVAESPRRGRIYSAGPDSIRRFLDSLGEVPYGGDARPISASSYEEEADRLRDERAVVKVLCRVSNR